MAKTAPYPPCTPATHCVRAGRCVTAFWLKNRDSARCLRRVTLTEPSRRAVTVNGSSTLIWKALLPISLEKERILHSIIDYYEKN